MMKEEITKGFFLRNRGDDAIGKNYFGILF
jgi:hypothetical protein